ncbi:MAG: hypothetical protein PHR28_11350 [candidate division Zixibacteria bacterium]|nr:hypothetical protein [candidate division Zixibacteria bacterium]
MTSRIPTGVILVAVGAGCVQAASAGVTTGIDIAPQVNSAFGMIALGFVVIAGVLILRILSSWH